MSEDEKPDAPGAHTWAGPATEAAPEAARDARVYYETTYTYPDRKTGRVDIRTYRTKTLTDYHTHVRESYAPAVTMRCDPNVVWPFGTWAEVVAKSDAKLVRQGEVKL